jgi:hypothetical protein
VNKGLQIAINHPIDVAHFGFGAVVLDQAVRLQNIRPDLRSEIDIKF